MTTNPFIPIPVMAIICVLLLVMKRKGVWNFIRQIIIVLLIFGMNLRILIPTDTVIVAESQVDVLLVIDNTISMVAEDYSRNNSRRIDGVKDDVNDIVSAFPDARFALITFNNTANCIVPYTSEKELILQSVDNLQTLSAVSADGTSLNISISTMERTLERNVNPVDDEDERLATRNVQKRLQVVFFISDGEITNGERLRSFEGCAEYIDTGAVLGYGTRDGAVMRVRDYSTSELSVLTYYDNNFNRVTAHSYIDEGNLEDIADDLGVPYYHMQSRRDIKDILEDITDQIDEGEFMTVEEKIEGYGETYQWFALALFLFVCVDYVITRLKMRHER